MKFTWFSILAFLLFTGNAKAQHLDSAEVWMQFMLEPNPNYYKVKSAFYKYWGDSVPNRSYGYKVFKRWEWRAVQHMDQYGNITWPKQQLSDFLSATSNSGGPMPGGGNVQQGVSGGGGSQGVAACPQGGRWNPVGPIRHPFNQTGQPTGIGRINGIAFDPKDSNTLFVCAPQGGVWKTKDNGQNWTQLFGQGSIVNSIGTSSMLISYNNSDTMYVGTGDRDAGDAPGYGVIASWNGGKTWVSRNSGMGNYAVGRMVMHPTNSSIILASTNNGIYRTTNGGASWTQVLSGNSWDVAYKPTDPSVAYAIIGANFYRSTNGGVNWSLITSGLPTTGIQRAMLAVTKADANYVYLVISDNSSGFYGVYQSTDGGANFSNKSTTPNILGYSETGAGSGGQAWYDLDISADPLNKNTIFVHGINIWKSTNGGTNWTISGQWVGQLADDIHADQHSGEFNTTGRKLYAGNDGGIYYSSDGGARWVNISTGIMNSQIYRLAQSQTDAFTTAQGYQDNGSAQSQQDEFFTYYGGDGMDCAADPTDRTYVYGSYVYGRIYRAIDKNAIITLGANGTNGINEGGGWLTPFVLQEGTPARMFAGYVNVWRCDNVKTTGTPSWTKISSGFSGNVRQLESSPADPKILYAIDGAGQLQRSDNSISGSPSWTNLVTNQPSGLRHVQAHHKNSNIVYGINGNAIFKSTNKGANWTSYKTVPSASGSPSCMVIDTSSKTEFLYIGTDKGVLTFDSVTNSLTEFNTGFPNWADVTDLEIWYSPKGQSESHIVASTYGMGVWRSNLYEDGTKIPKANFYAFDSVFTVGGKMRLYEKVKFGASSLRWKITPYKYQYTEGTDSTSRNPVIVFSGSTLFTVRLVASNCQGSDTLTKSLWVRVHPATKAPVCRNTTTWSSSNYGMGIMRFHMSDNMSETGGYFDDGEHFDLNSKKVFRIKPSTTYTLKVKTGLYYSEYVRVFIDYNNNGRFDSYNSEITASSYALGERSFTITTPSNLKANTPLRMRVMSDYNSLDTNACRNLGYGQSEDYTLVYENPKPLFKVAKTAACQFENLVFTDTSQGLVALYEWDFGVGASPRTAVGAGPHTVQYTTTGNKNVRLRINGLDSLRKNNYINVSAGPVPVVRVKSGSTAGCEGFAVTLAVKNSSGGPFTVQWQKNGVNIAGKTDTLLTFTSTAYADSGSYRAVLSNGGCVINSSSITLSVYPKPLPSFTINRDQQCQRYHNFVYQTTSTIPSGSITTTSWNYGDGFTGSGVSVSRKYSAAGNYNVKMSVISNRGCKDSATKPVKMFVNATPKFTVNDSDQCISGNSFVFTNTSSVSSGTLSHTWQFGNGNTSTSTSPTYNYPSSGIYTVRLITQTNNSCLDSITKPVRVYSKPSVSFSFNSAAQCFKGHNFTTTNNSTNTDGSLSYAWKFGDGGSSSVSAPTKKYTSYGAYNVKLVATSTFGCKDSSSATATVHPQGVLKFTVNDTDQCLNNNNFKFTNNSSIPSGTLSYNWAFGDGGTSTSVSPNKTYSSANTFKVWLYSNSNQNCKDTASSLMRVYSQPQMAFTINTASQCLKGNKFNFTNGTTNQDGALAYKWDYANGKATTTNSSSVYATHGSYSVKLVATSIYGCADSITKPITVFPQAKLSFSINDSDQCVSGNSFVFTNNSTVPTGSLSYSWAFGDNTSSTATSPTKNYLFYGFYTTTLVGITNSGCRDTMSKKIRVYSPPNVDFAIDKSIQCLKGNKFNFTNNSTNADASFSSNWSFGDAGKSTLLSPSHTYAIDGDLTVKLVVKTGFNCADSITKPITVYPKAKMAFTVNDSDQCLSGNNFLFTNTSNISRGVINSYQWKFGDGNHATAVSPGYAYSSHGIYTVALSALSNGMCRDTTQKLVRVYAHPVPVFNTLPGLNACFKYNKFTSTNNSSIAEGSTTAVWNNGDGSGSSGASNSHSYALHGSYPLKMVVTTNFGCKDSVTETIVVKPTPVPQFLPSKSLFCERDSIGMNNTSSIAQGIYTQKWEFGQGAFSSISNPKTAYSAYGNYSILLELTSNLGCKDSLMKQIEVASVPKVGFTIQPPAGCAGQTTFGFNATTTNPDGRPVAHSWTFGDGNLGSGNVVNHKYLLPKTYAINLNAQSAVCKADSTRLLPVSRTVFAAFKVDSINPETRRFTALDSNFAGYQFHWNFGDGDTQTAWSVVHTFPDNAVYPTKLVVLNNIGCGDTNSQNIAILSPNYKDQDNVLNFYVYPNPTPNSFTYKFVIDQKRDVEIKLYDILAQKPLYTKVWSQIEPGTYYESINMEELGFSAGTYPLIIQSGSDRLVVKVIFTH